MIFYTSVKGFSKNIKVVLIAQPEKKNTKPYCLLLVSFINKYVIFTSFYKYKSSCFRVKNFYIESLVKTRGCGLNNQGVILYGGLKYKSWYGIIKMAVSLL